MRLHSVHYEVHDYAQYSFEVSRKLQAKRVGPAVLRRSRKRRACVLLITHLQVTFFRSEKNIRA